MNRRSSFLLLSVRDAVTLDEHDEVIIPIPIRYENLDGGVEVASILYNGGRVSAERRGGEGPWKQGWGDRASWSATPERAILDAIASSSAAYTTSPVDIFLLGVWQAIRPEVCGLLSASLGWKLEGITVEDVRLQFSDESRAAIVRQARAFWLEWGERIASSGAPFYETAWKYVRSREGRSGLWDTREGDPAHAFGLEAHRSAEAQGEYGFCVGDNGVLRIEGE